MEGVKVLRDGSATSTKFTVLIVPLEVIQCNAAVNQEISHVVFRRLELDIGNETRKGGNSRIVPLNGNTPRDGAGSSGSLSVFHSKVRAKVIAISPILRETTTTTTTTTTTAASSCG
jgi:hypothetical protein